MPKIRIGALVQINNVAWKGQTGVIVSYRGKGQNSHWAGDRWVVMHGDTEKDLNWFYEDELEVLV